MNKIYLFIINLLLVVPLMAQLNCPLDVTIDGTTYTVVHMGNRCWTAQSMRHAHYADGTDITPSPMEYVDPDGSSLDPRVYGKLYIGNAAFRNRQMDATGRIQGICPDGWHIPNTLEMNELLSLYTPQQMMSSTAWIPQNGTNESGFNLMPAGYYNTLTHRFERAFVSGVFWTTTMGTPVYHECQFGSACSTWEVVPGDSIYAYSVRCVRDDVVIHDTITFMPNGATGGTMNKQMVPPREATTLTSNNYTHEGNWEFTGWNTDELGNGTFYANGADITTNGNVTLYAQWKTWCTGTPKTGETGTGHIESIQDYNGNTYKVVQIGNQCWMKENLKSTHYANGTHPNTISGAYSYAPGSSDPNVAVYGYLYNWKAAMKGAGSSSTNPSYVQGICPNGWHVPSDAEWSQLTNYVSNQSQYLCGGSSSNIAKALSSTIRWNSYSGTCVPGDNPSANNTTGFSSIPAGNFDNSSYNNFGDRAYYWSSTESNNDNAYGCGLYNDEANRIRYNDRKNIAFSVRCVRDAFTCGVNPVKDHQGNVYNTVQIGNQCWTKENMRCTTSPSTGTNILESSSNGYSYSGKKAYYYDDISANRGNVLYNWCAAVDTFNTAIGETSTSTNGNDSPFYTFSGHRRGICPQNWHVPSYAEWSQLTDYVGSRREYQCDDYSSYIAKALATTSGWTGLTYSYCAVSYDPSTNNATGFSAYPTGFYDSEDYNGLYNTAVFWSSTLGNYSGRAYGLSLNYLESYVTNDTRSMKLGYSVRCVHD